MKFHPMTWWIAALIVSVAVSISNNSTLNLIVLGGISLLVYLYNHNASEKTPWSGGLWFALKLSAFIIVIRTLIGILIGVPVPGNTLFEIPILYLPEWMAGIRIGGAITQERLSFAIAEGLKISTLICLFAAATSLTSPHRLLRQAPIFIYQFGIALVIATSVFPQLIASATRIKSAQQMRGLENKGWARVVLPLLEESLARSLNLAAAMDSRGYGFSRTRSQYRKDIWASADSSVLLSALVLLGASLVVIK
jgi:energy-coupling factor transporter transmembrane protein EcfT